MDEEKRVTFKTKFDYMLNLVGLMVGFSNIWRFPYICYKNGGGAFILAYLIFIVVLFLPLAAIESSLGQYTGKTVVKIWYIVPLFKGLGYSSLFFMSYWNSYLAVMMSWAVRWLYASFSTDPVWMRCNNTWNTNSCIPILNSENMMNSSIYKDANQSGHHRSCVEEFFNNHLLGKSEGLHDYGTVKLDLLLCLAIVWICAYFAVWKGIGWTSKIVYFTATTPFIILIVLVIRGVTLEGAGQGLKEYLAPDATKLAKIELWTDAASQVIFSFGVCTGSLPTMSMFNKYKHNYVRDILFMTIANTLASFLAGIVCFTVLGHLAFQQDTTIDKIADKGPGLAFVVYPTAMSLFPQPQVWCVLFFVTMLLVGFDSLFVYHEALVCCIKDIAPQWFRFKYSSEVWMAATMLVLFAVGLTMITPGGIYVLEIMNNYSLTGWSVFFIALTEYIIIGWFFGSERMCDIIQDMSGCKLLRTKTFLNIIWKYVGPIICLLFAFYSLSNYRTLKLDSYLYPMWANIIGWIIALTSSLTLPIGAAWVLYKAKGDTFTQKWRNALEKRDLRRPIEVNDKSEEERMMKKMSHD